MLRKDRLEEAFRLLDGFFTAASILIRTDQTDIRPEAKEKLDLVISKQDELWHSWSVIANELERLKDFVDEVNSAGEG